MCIGLGCLYFQKSGCTPCIYNKGCWFDGCEETEERLLLKQLNKDAMERGDDESEIYS